jgi:hypothetical protein
LITNNQKYSPLSSAVIKAIPVRRREAQEEEPIQRQERPDHVSRIHSPHSSSLLA